MSRRLHTRIVLAQLRAAGPIRPRKRIGRMPRPVEPKTIALEYRKAIVRAVCERARAAFNREKGAIVEALIEERRARGIVEETRGDARTRRDAPMIGGGRGAAIGAGRAAQLGAEEAARAGRKALPIATEFEEELSQASELGARAARLIDRAAAAFAAEFRPSSLIEIVKQFGKRTSEHARLQLDRQLRAAIGVPFSAIERASRDRLEEWAAANIDLITSISDRYFDRLRGDVEEAFTGGMHPATFADLLEERYEMSERQAETIARDQTLKLSADLSHDRMEGLGVEWAVWRTVRDGRVCPICEALERTRFKLSEGVDGVLPGGCHPMDRCWSEPDLSTLIDG